MVGEPILAVALGRIGEGRIVLVAYLENVLRVERRVPANIGQRAQVDPLVAGGARPVAGMLQQGGADAARATVWRPGRVLGLPLIGACSRWVSTDAWQGRQ